MLFVILCVVSFIVSVNGLDAKIGNSRMILRANTGESVERYIQVINPNNVSVNIELSASGNLKDYIRIKDRRFTLESGESKQAYFTVEVKRPGTTESRIYVKFSSIDGGDSIGIISTIIVITKKSEGFFDFGILGGDDEIGEIDLEEGDINEGDDEEGGVEEEANVDDDDDDDEEVDEDEKSNNNEIIPNYKDSVVEGIRINKELPWNFIFLCLPSMILVIVFIVLMFFGLRKKPRVKNKDKKGKDEKGKDEKGKDEKEKNKKGKEGKIK